MPLCTERVLPLEPTLAYDSIGGTERTRGTSTDTGVGDGDGTGSEPGSSETTREIGRLASDGGSSTAFLIELEFMNGRKQLSGEQIYSVLQY